MGFTLMRVMEFVAVPVRCDGYWKLAASGEDMQRVSNMQMKSGIKASE